MTRLRIILGPGSPLAGAAPDGSHAPVEFHVGASARRKYRFPDSLFRSEGNVVFADFRAVREFAARMNERRPPGMLPVKAGELNAMGLIDEILHFVFRLYEASNPGVLARATAALEGSIGRSGFHATLQSFTDSFPPVAVFNGGIGARGWLDGETGGRRHSEVALEEIFMLHLGNANPAFMPFRELFDDAALAAVSPYGRLISGLRSFLRAERPFGPGGGSIVDLLEAPMRASPHSLSGQLSFMRDSWGVILSDDFRRRILSAADLSREDAKEYPTGGHGNIGAPDFSLLARRRHGDHPETENFTHDSDWMPNVVLLAKNAYVWLHQLSRAYGRRVTRLDEVPDEELDRLRYWNFTSLWLIGVWHRSAASETIKKLTGNPEAAPSAYSLYRYEIAPELGGEEAFDNLASRAWQRGIRLAADMVPNHTGIASEWIRDHPDRYIQTDYPPFPSYRFTGPDLSGDPAYQVRIEDGYWTRSDAAVVFQHVDNRTGRLRYIYHGNDGTNMPWNDTAQLDFLNASVREAVIGEILEVAKKFSVIRFDAAMTLTRKHFQRLWYPQPGSGGDIPSRADFGTPQEEFDRRFPAEFWREVVDRINAERPNTLLLAEAFWLLEGYFVRTLGMHRVYNSAFMHMLMKEDNAGYRSVIRNTLHFNPEILKRYVNFMSNPDERTAVDQFGKGDKYFGIATLMATMPGLPMFAHGQIEGYREKYGMEYRRDYHDESPDGELVARHEREIFPLLGQRPLFSQTHHFELYNVAGQDGAAIEHIFAYSNMDAGRRALVCYNNTFDTLAGTIMRTAGKMSAGSIRYSTLGEALELNGGDGVYYLFREQRSGLEYLRSGRELAGGGLFVRLRAFECQVFLDFREIHDHDGSWSALHGELRGAGAADAASEAAMIRLRPFHEAFRSLVDPGPISSLLKPAGADRETRLESELGRRLDTARKALAEAGGNGRPIPRVRAGSGSLPTDLRRFIEAMAALGASPGVPPAVSGVPPLTPGALRVLLAWASVRELFGRGVPVETPLPSGVFGEWMLGRVLTEAFGKSGPDGPGHARIVEALACSPAAPAEFFSAPAVRECLGVNEYGGTVYFHKESFERVLEWYLLREAFRRGLPAGHAGKAWAEILDELAALRGRLGADAGAVGYRLGEFLTLSAGPVPAPSQEH